MEADYEKAWNEAHETQLNMYSRVLKYENILAQFNGEKSFDPEFVCESLEDVRVRDALLHYCSNKFQIDLFGAESTLDDCSELRQNFAQFLMIATDEYGELKAGVGSTLCGLAMLDGMWETATQSAEILVQSNKGNRLAHLLVMARSIGADSVDMFTQSVETTNINECLYF